MNKTIKLLLTSLLLLCLFACSTNKTNENNTNNEPKNEIADLIEKGYQQTQTSYFDNKWLAIYEKDGNFKDAYKVELTMDQETFDKLFELDIFDEEQEKQYNEIVQSIPDCVITPMEYKPSDEDELNSFVGKTIKELENAGYERSGYSYDDEGCVFYAEGPIYSINIKTNEVITEDTIDDYSENAIRELIIKEVEITGFSYKIFD